MVESNELHDAEKYIAVIKELRTVSKKMAELEPTETYIPSNTDIIRSGYYEISELAGMVHFIADMME